MSFDDLVPVPVTTEAYRRLRKARRLAFESGRRLPPTEALTFILACFRDLAAQADHVTLVPPVGSGWAPYVVQVAFEVGSNPEVPSYDPSAPVVPRAALEVLGGEGAPEHARAAHFDHIMQVSIELEVRSLSGWTIEVPTTPARSIGRYFS